VCFVCFGFLGFCHFRDSFFAPALSLSDGPLLKAPFDRLSLSLSLMLKSLAVYAFEELSLKSMIFSIMT
jgi:hypothetical protein